MDEQSKTNATTEAGTAPAAADSSQSVDTTDVVSGATTSSSHTAVFRQKDEPFKMTLRKRTRSHTYSLDRNYKPDSLVSFASSQDSSLAGNYYKQNLNGFTGSCISFVSSQDSLASEEGLNRTAFKMPFIPGAKPAMNSSLSSTQLYRSLATSETSDSPEIYQRQAGKKLKLNDNQVIEKCQDPDLADLIDSIYTLCINTGTTVNIINRKVSALSQQPKEQLTAPEPAEGAAATTEPNTVPGDDVTDLGDNHDGDEEADVVEEDTKPMEEDQGAPAAAAAAAAHDDGSQHEWSGHETQGQHPTHQISVREIYLADPREAPVLLWKPNQCADNVKPPCTSPSARSEQNTFLATPKCQRISTPPHTCVGILS